LAITNVIPAPNQTRQATAPPAPMAVSVNVGDILSASIWPPEVRINLPVLEVMPSAEPVEPQSASSSPGPPEWALSRLQEPAGSAQSTLADLIPPSLRSLAGLLVVRRSDAE
jgi:hypothetical protein